MKVVTFAQGNSMPRPGVLESKKVYDITEYGFRSTLELIEGDADALKAIRGATSSNASYALDEIHLLAPIQRPPRIFAVGLNYQEHAAESKMTVHVVPTVFMKLSSSVTGPDTEVILPKNSAQPDYEAELAVVIGKPGYRIAARDWEKHVFGYTIVNDVSARDVQLATSQWTLGKSFPTFTPLGPAVVTRDEIADPHALDIQLAIDGEVLQNSNTKNLIFRIPQLIEHISSLTPLEAGDIISTGTPQGVGLGRTPQRWLRDNEEIVITIAGLGKLRNRTRAEA
ncbi:fumarylacetoacetate hydrolase family protein [Tunturiibacter gelidoferens]|uniref:Fumarylacetoacetate hydrolase family protein n=1 Tax=Tunturiibacter gelidiferens TaxID=3069689 RepID=A0AAU7Z623_9BACT